MNTGALDPQGPVAEAMAGLWWLMLALGVAVFLLFAGLLVAALLRRRGDDEPTEDDSRRTFRWLALGGVAMPLVVIVVVFGATLQAMRSVPASASAGALEIEVVGHQFWYEVRYPAEGVVTANELHLPVGREIALRLESSDVIHSFWVPELGGKLDMLPDHANTLVLEADAPGEYRSRCAEFCGLQHTKMALVVVAEEQEAFTDWLATQRGDAAEPATPAAREGREVFVESGCVSCHAAPGLPSRGTGPDLTGLAHRRTLAAGTLPNTTDELGEWITDPQAIKPGADMPATQLDPGQLESLLAYLEGGGA